MGGSLSRPVGRFAASAYDLADRLYRRWHRLERVGGIFHVGLETWRGAPRRLEDGTEVTRGSTIARLHLDSQAVTAGSAGAGSAAGAGRRVANQFVPACQALARRLGDDPRWAAVVALHGVSWISPYVSERWGFEAERLADGPRTRMLRWHLGNLLAVAGDRRRPRPWPVAFWMSRRRLCRRYCGSAAGR